MVDFHITKVHSLMTNPKNIRNISVIAHVDHGKSTLTDTLVVRAKIVSKDQSGSRYMDSRKDEQERGITIKSSAISLHHKMDIEVLEAYTDEDDRNGNEFLINLIDSPGHVDFSSEVTAALRVTDGALVVVDCIEGICVQTETVLTQAMEEKIMPTLCLNKLDRPILELEFPSGLLFESLRKRVEDFNAKLSSISQGFTVEPLKPEKNEISFCSGLQGWGFTLRTFARFYLEKFKLQGFEGEKKLSAFLWKHNISCTSDDPWDPNMKFINKMSDEKSPFTVFVLNPIYKVRDMCNEGDVKGIKEFLKKYNVDFTNVRLTEKGKALFKIVMREWLPAAECLLEQIVVQLPNPLKSQAIRFDHLYEGPVDDEVSLAIKNCDSTDNAPVMMYVSKMIPGNDNKFIAFGRVFSGKLVPGMKIKVQEPGYNPLDQTTANKALCHSASILRTVVMMGRGGRDVPDVPAGNIVGIIGIDDCLRKTGTICNREGSYNIKSMKFSVSPVVKVAVSAKRPEDLSKLQEGLRKLAQSDPLCVVERNEKGQCTIACAGTLHLEICLKDLEEQYAKIPIISEQPMVTYFESISEPVEKPMMTKSANKHNRLYMVARPLEEEIYSNLINVRSENQKTLAANFREILNINEDWIKKVWDMAPELIPENILVDGTKGISIIGEIKEHLSTGFKVAVQEGPLIGETMKGVRFDLVDATLHADTIHRGINQLLQPTVKLCKGLILAGSPILYEPIFKVVVTAPEVHRNTVVGILASKRGIAEEFISLPGGNTVNIIGTLPVRESFTINEEFKSSTQGKAGISFSFSHYSILPGSMSDENSIMAKTVQQVRQIKKMNNSLVADDYFDKL